MAILANLLIVLAIWLSIIAICLIAYGVGWITVNLLKWLFDRVLWVKWFSL